MQFSSIPDINFLGSPDLASWLKSVKSSIVVALPKQNKLISFGQVGGQLKIFDRTIPGCSSLCRSGDTLFVAAKHQIWKFQNIYTNQNTKTEFDALFWPKESWTIGDVDLHDMYVHKGIPPIFVNTLFSCVSTLDDEYSFKVMWSPDFISQILPEDRCHMTGLAIDHDRKVPRYITVLAKTDSYEEWRIDYRDSGALIDMASGKTVAEGLSLPYSPRIYKKNLYCLEAGRGALVKIDEKQGTKEDICFIPGFARGLDFIGDYAIVGTSKPRKNKTFEGLELETRLNKEKQKPVCGFHIINLKTGKIEHSMACEGPFEDIYDLVVINNIETCSFIGFKTHDIEKVFYLAHD